MSRGSRGERSRISTCALAISFVSLTACTKTQVVQGECREVYGANICASVELAAETVSGFGVTVPLASIENAPAGGEMVWPPAPIAVIALPARVTEQTGFSHFELNWEHHGHPPPVYMKPHFDFHFYTIPPQEVEAIDCADSSKPSQPPPDYVLPDITIPELGELVGLCVPAMGMHAMPEKESVSSEPFTASMLVGYYHGNLIFLEPMVSRSALLEEKSFALEIPEIPGLAAGLRTPTKFEAQYDAAARAYRLTFWTAAGGSATR